MKTSIRQTFPKAFLLIGLVLLLWIPWVSGLLLRHIPSPVAKSMPWVTRALEMRAQHIYVSDFIALLALATALAFKRANRRLHEDAAEKAQKCLDAALMELASRIMARVEDPTLLTPDLLTPHSIKSLAVAIERRHKCPILTDALIAEGIRSAAFDLELQAGQSGGHTLVNRLELLNEILKAFDTNRSGLLSIARVDRCAAYRSAQPVVMNILFVLAIILFAIAVFRGWTALLVLSVGLFLFLMVALAVGSKRAAHFWGDTGAESANLRNRFIRQLSKPERPTALLDTFFLAATSRSRSANVFWDIIVGPLWENVFHRDFLRSHRYRVLFAKELSQGLHQAQLRLVDAVRHGNESRPAHLDVVRLNRRLWEVTGEDKYRLQAHRMTSASEVQRDEIVHDLKMIVDDEHFSSKSLAQSLERQRRTFFLNAASGVNPESQVALLKKIIHDAEILWQRTSDDGYRTVADQSAGLLANFEATGQFIADKWRDTK